MRAIILMLILTLSAACSTNSLSAKMASWQGSHIDEISSVWGAPDECFDRDGRQLCSWSQTGAFDSQTFTSDSFNPRPMCIRIVEIDDSGVITGWRWRGDRCPDTAAEVLAKTRPTRPEVMAETEQAGTLELAVIEPAEPPAISRTQ